MRVRFLSCDLTVLVSVENDCFQQKVRMFSNLRQVLYSVSDLSIGYKFYISQQTFTFMLSFIWNSYVKFINVIITLTLAYTIKILGFVDFSFLAILAILLHVFHYTTHPQISNNT